jgi:hypothetical protein
MERLQKLLDQDGLEMQFCQLFGEWVKKNLVENRERRAVELRCSRFRPLFAGDLVMSQALQADMQEEFLECDIGIRPSWACQKVHSLRN